MTRGAGVRGIEHEIARAKRTGEALTLAFVDVDRLKRVNDAQGHACATWSRRCGQASASPT